MSEIALEYTNCKPAANIRFAAMLADEYKLIFLFTIGGSPGLTFFNLAFCC